MSFKYYTFLFLISIEIMVKICEGFPSDWSRSIPCTGYVSKAKPKLNGRISERKCQEYSWEMNDRIRNDLHLSKCGTPQYGVIHGKPSKITEFPHMAAIGWIASDVEIKWEFFCGGSLISDRFVLTAAHCSWVKTSETIKDSVPKIVRLGTTYITEETLSKLREIENPTDIQIKQIIKHERYHSPKRYFDIALIELRERVNFSKFIQPACLHSESNLDTSRRFKAAGWGKTIVLGDHRSPNLRSTELHVFETNECTSMNIPLTNRNFDGIQEHQLCATGNDTDTCQGDSGGPLMYKMIEGNEEKAEMHMIVAVTAFGWACNIKDVPGIYSKVSYFIDWIEKKVWPEELKSTPKYKFRHLPLQSQKIVKKVEDTPIIFPEIDYSEIIFPDEIKKPRRLLNAGM